MDRTIGFILSLSIILPFASGLARYRSTTSASYQPLVILLFIGLINELICYLIYYPASNAVPVNLYYIAEALLLTWQFHLWKNILKPRWAFLLLSGFLSAIWVAENILFGQLTEFSPVFQVVYSIIMILLAVNQLNWLITNEHGIITRNPIFLICTAIIIFFSYKVLAEIFYFYAHDNVMKSNIFVIESYLNVGYNVLLTIAILCIPRKKTFMQPLW